MPIKLIDGGLEAATSGRKSSEVGIYAGLSRKHDKAKERACCESEVCCRLSILASTERASWKKHTFPLYISFRHVLY